MLTTAIASFLCGLLLGWRFRVGAAVGASLIAFLGTLAHAASQGFPWWLASLSIMVNVTALQMGYLGACALIVASRARGARVASAVPPAISARNFAAPRESALFMGRGIETGAP
jgi:hypothetical protein